MSQVSSHLTHFSNTTGEEMPAWDREQAHYFASIKQSTKLLDF